MSKRIYELWKDGECVFRSDTIKECDRFIADHKDEHYIFFNKPYYVKMKINSLGGKEVY